MRCWFDDETCGKHSGIPECCRKFFQTVIRKALGIHRIHGYGYIPCPGCRHCDSIVKLKQCPR